MNPKPYKQNKSALKQFLDKKAEVLPVPKGAVHSVPGMNPYRKTLDELFLNGSEEDKARLEATGWTPQVRPAKERDFYYLKKLRMFKEEDAWKTNDSIHSWFILGRTFVKANHWQVEKEKYFVAGKGYASREDFLFSRTGLGRELL